MITLETWDGDGGVWLQMTGHSEPAQGDQEKIQVCAACSVLMTSLAVLAGNIISLRASAKEAQSLDGTGFVKCFVKDSMLRVAEFTIGGIGLVEANYVGHVLIQRRDTKLFVSQETIQWNPESPPKL